MIEVLREGEPTVDGRFINRGATVLPDEPVPLFDWDRREDKDHPQLVGALFNFNRNDDRIYCESSLDDDERQITVTVAVDSHEEVAGEVVGMSKIRIVGGVIGDELAYPWKTE